MKVSVCIPTFNQSPYLEQAIRSVCIQTFKPFEIIVSNDCSTDNTKDVLDKLGKEILVLKVVHQPKNLGMNRNTDACLRLATGDFIVKLDSDDFLLPTYIEKLQRLLCQYPNAGYAHAAVQEIDENGNPTKLRYLARKYEYCDADNALKSVVKGYKVAANIIMFRRLALEKVNYIESKVNFAEDFYLSASLASAGYGNVYVNEVLSSYRVWLDSGEVRQKRKLDEIYGLIIIYENVLQPAFQLRGWNIKKIKQERTQKACVHINCLSWNVYSKDEKLELRQAIYQLSATQKVQIYAWLYQHNKGGILNSYASIQFYIKSRLKKILYRLRK